MSPPLRHVLYCFNPLAGGFLTDRYHRDTKDVEQGGRFDRTECRASCTVAAIGTTSTLTHWTSSRPIAKKHGLTETECALRWLSHHSQLKREKGDAIIVGASSTKHLEENLAALDQGPLPEEVVQALEAGWQRVRGKELKFWH